MRKGQRYMRPEERYVLEGYLRAGIPVYQVAREMGFSHQTIYREKKLGAVQVTREINGIQKDVVEYSAQKANQVHEYAQGNKGGQLKIGNHIDLANRLEELMLGVQSTGEVDPAKRYSPAAAIAQAKAEGYELSISVNTLYSYIYTGIFARMTAKNLIEGRRPRKKGGVKEVKIAHPTLPSIEIRPKDIKFRYVYGHWEMDLIIGKRGKGPVLLTFTERKGRLEIVRKLPNRKAETIRAAIDRLETEYPTFRQMFQTITTDNGAEFLQYEDLVTSTHGGKRMNVYYCHSYAAWEKGTNERNNRMLRRKWPKGTSFNGVSQEEIDDYVDWLNHYPRKILGWKSPAEVTRFPNPFAEVLSDCNC